MDNTDKPKAYIGKHITYKGNSYYLAHERCKGGCKDCDIRNQFGCTTELTDYCRQGFILKKIGGNK